MSDDTIQTLFRAAGGLQVAQAMLGERGERRSTPMWVIDQDALQRLGAAIEEAAKHHRDASLWRYATERMLADQSSRELLRRAAGGA